MTVIELIYALYTLPEDLPVVFKGFSTEPVIDATIDEMVINNKTETVCVLY